MSNKIELFAGLNGIDGYVPLLEYTLSPMKRVFILKGSPGSGKSTVMKRIAARAEAEGHPLTVIRCSSDPDSLDGVMLTDLGVAVADGTSPHSLDPKKYGIREVTVSLEDTFDYDRLGFFSGRLGNAPAAEIPSQRHKQLQGIGKYRSLPARLCGRVLPHTAAERSLIGGDAVGG